VYVKSCTRERRSFQALDAGITSPDQIPPVGKIIHGRAAADLLQIKNGFIPVTRECARTWHGACGRSDAGTAPASSPAEVSSETIVSERREIEMKARFMEMKRMGVSILGLLLLAACAAPQTNTQKGAVYGSAGGAAAGAIVGQVIGHNTKSTLIGSAIGAAVGGLGGAGIGRMMDNQERDMRNALASSEAAAVSREGNLLAVTFKGDVTFDTNSTVVRPGLLSEIDRVASVVNQYPSTLVRVEGHTDSTGSDAYNMDLSNRRALAVKSLLVQRGVAENRIDVVGYGKAMPVAGNHTEAGRQRNRRVEIKIAPQGHSYRKKGEKSSG
jgi:outer membrane protein OmpA-like peptidoglycan-associated protein